MKKILFFILGFTLIFSDSYKVIKVSDGDTITVMSLQQYNKFKVRLYGIDAPESDQSFGTQSKQFLSDQILNREIDRIYRNEVLQDLEFATDELLKKLYNKLTPELNLIITEALEHITFNLCESILDVFGTKS